MTKKQPVVVMVHMEPRTEKTIFVKVQMYKEPKREERTIRVEVLR